MTCPYLESMADNRNNTNVDTQPIIYSNDDHEPLNYTTYLRTEPLLSALKCLSHTNPSDDNSSPVHDEHFFILIHQVFELWFKQILFEIDSIRDIFRDNTRSNNVMLPMFNINNRLNRCVQIWNILLDQLQLLETMTPIEFLEFRDYITPASGFQSLQFRIIEFKLGLTDKSRFQFYEKYFTKVMFKNSQSKELKSAASDQSLLVLLQSWLEQIYETTSFKFLDIYTTAVEEFIDHAKKQKIANNTTSDIAEDEANNTRKQFSPMLNEAEYAKLQLTNQRRLSHKAMLAALMISVYHQHPYFQQAYQMLYLLMDIDALIANWRHKHVLLVQRQIGRKPGTGGTGGLSYLTGTLNEQYQIFIDLFNVASYLIPQSFLPSFTDSLISPHGEATFQSLSKPIVYPHRDVPIVIRQPAQSNLTNDTPFVLIYGIILLIPFLGIWMLTNLVRGFFSS